MNCLVGQSGGPTSVINSTLAGVIQAGLDNKFDKIFVLKHGIEGLIKDNIEEVDKEKFLKENIRKGLMKTPSSILGSCRFKLPDNLEDEIYDLIFEKFRELNITNFIYIGGNDSMDTVMKLNKYMKKNNITGINIVGAPKTIDNDLIGMDHSPGFGSAAKYIVNTIIDVRQDIDIYDINTVTFVEIMGRNTGWLAASSLLANYGKKRKIVNLLYLSEESVSKEKIIEDIKRELKNEKNLLVVVSEGFMDTENFFKHEEMRSYDKGFNHPIISGISRNLAEFVYQELGIKTKAVELSITQRVNHMISKTDSNEAFFLGYNALILSLSNTDIVPVVIRKDKEKYDVRYEYVKSSDIANQEKQLPNEWLANDDILQEKIVEYALPLIQGEFKHNEENGMHSYVKLEDFIK